MLSSDYVIIQRHVIIKGSRMQKHILALSLLCSMYGTLYTVTQSEHLLQQAEPTTPRVAFLGINPEPVLQNIQNILAYDEVQKPKTLRAIINFCKYRPWQPTRVVDGLRLARCAQHALDDYKKYSQETDDKSRMYRKVVMHNADKCLMSALCAFFGQEESL